MLFDWLRASPRSIDSAVCEWGMRRLVYKLLFKSTFAIGFNYNEAVSYFRTFNFHSCLVVVLPLLRALKCVSTTLISTCYFGLAFDFNNFRCC